MIEVEIENGDKGGGAWILHAEMTPPLLIGPMGVNLSLLRFFMLIQICKSTLVQD